jgi:hypothetical protein
MFTKSFSTAPKFALLQTLAVAIQTGTPGEAAATLQRLRAMPEFQSPAWVVNLGKLATVLRTHEPAFKLFALGGNKKLPFVAWSTLPGVTCPGAGACLDFCYSFRAWRYPAAFARQAQNAFLMRHHRAPIAEAFQAIAQARPDGFDFRLYVDGDFSSVADVSFWMHHLNLRPQVRAYGYSKSFAQLLAHDATGAHWPENYLLNISSGHNATPEVVAQVRALPITRGDFVAVSIGRVVKSSEHGTPEVNRALRAAFQGKAFPCPGTCGTCTGKGHACGLQQLRGVPVVIAIH